MAFVEAYRDEDGVEPICAALEGTDAQITPSTYYAYRSPPPSARAVTNAELIGEIRRVHTENLGVYGARKIHAELVRECHRAARCTVELAIPQNREGMRYKE